MGAVDIRVELDTRQLEAWAGQTTKAINSQLRSAVTRSARYSRAQAVKVMAKDANVPMARLRKAVPLVQAPRSGSGGLIAATWTVGKSGNIIRSAGGAAPAFTRGTPVEVSTFATTGGGSSALSLPKGFVIIGKGGNRLVVTRNGKGRSDFKAIYAADPRAMLGQEDGAARKAWQTAAETSLPLLLTAAVSAALAGSAAEPAPGRFGMTSNTEGQ
ncbi:MAG: hypothetical protein ACRYGP_17480 [Janthinobacterium lividum]